MTILFPNWNKNDYFFHKSTRSNNFLHPDATVHTKCGKRSVKLRLVKMPAVIRIQSHKSSLSTHRNIYVKKPSFTQTWQHHFSRLCKIKKAKFHGFPKQKHMTIKIGQKTLVNMDNQTLQSVISFPQNIKNFSGHKDHEPAVISISLALGQTPVYTTRQCMWA